MTKPSCEKINFNNYYAYFLDIQNYFINVPFTSLENRDTIAKVYWRDANALVTALFAANISRTSMTKEDLYDSFYTLGRLFERCGKYTTNKTIQLKIWMIEEFAMDLRYKLQKNLDQKLSLEYRIQPLKITDKHSEDPA